MNKKYINAVNLLTSVGKFHISLGLERITQVLDLLGNPQDKLKYIHVAGTNGKGSVCSMLSAILTEAGKKVGLFTSPHIFKYTERIKICDKPVSDDDFAKYVFEISDIAEKNNIDLTEFEILTAVMFKYFADNNVDVVVLETGLGGRFDATNVIKESLCSVITHVDFDHTERLGNTIEEIATEKAGIIKPNCPCIVLEKLQPFIDKGKEVNSDIIKVETAENIQNLSLKGLHQKENLSLVLKSIEIGFPQISPSTINEGLKKVKHIGRFQYVKEKNLIIDGAHNPNGVKALADSLEYYYPKAKRRFIFGCLANKEYKKMIKTLFKSGDEVYFYKFKHNNSCEVKELQSIWTSSKELTTDTKIDFEDGKLTIICGSLYMIKELAEKLKINIT